jgi:hypothetical protein
MRRDDFARGVEIVSEEISVRLALGDTPADEASSQGDDA